MRGLVVDDANQPTVRKFLLGRLPKEDRKVWVSRMLWEAKAPFEDEDQCDAFAVANWGLSELGAPCLTQRSRKATTSQLELGAGNGEDT